jgi:hypothetical protein
VCYKGTLNERSYAYTSDGTFKTISTTWDNNGASVFSTTKAGILISHFIDDYSTGYSGTIELIGGKGVSDDGCTLTFIAPKEAICSLLFIDPQTEQNDYIISV